MSDQTFRVAVVLALAVIAVSLYALSGMVASAWLERRLEPPRGTNDR